MTQDAANLATVISAAIAALALIVACWQFYFAQVESRRNLRTQAELLERDRETKAFELVLRFFEIKKGLSSNIPSDYTDPEFWSHNALVVLCETLYKLTDGSDEWSNTVDALLGLQEPFLAKNTIATATFHPKFALLLQAHQRQGRRQASAA